MEFGTKKNTKIIQSIKINYTTFRFVKNFNEFTTPYTSFSVSNFVKKKIIIKFLIATTFCVSTL